MVNFKQIELAGFKSFADKLDIKFESGITGIVGPNGCGKSNVADAVRWVLGEQSTKILRGSSMQDVIFNGTEKRKSLSYCEVSLVFDNTQRSFNLDFNEIVITRKLYRSGESEYLINRTPCRLKDITGALHDSGIGRDGYSIIGQGKVEEIISAKPENRRAIFEEAAGIAKFKQRKVEAERKLERTEQNLSQVQIVLSELERQLGPLKKQAENAKKYLELKEQLKHFEVNTYLYQFDSASENKGKIQTKIDAINEEIDIKQKSLTTATNKYNSNMQEISNIDKNIESLHNQILNLTVGLEKHTGETNVIKERIKFLRDEQDKLSADLLRQQNSKHDTLAAIDDNGIKLAKQQKLLDETKKQSEEIQEKYLAVVDELTKNEEEENIKQREMIEALNKMTDIKSNLSALKAQKEAYENNITEIDKKSASLSAKLDEKQKQQKQAEKQYFDAISLHEKCTKLASEKNAEMQTLQNNIAENNEAVMRNSTNIEILENRKKVLEDMQKDFEGYAYSVKRLMQDSKTNTVLKSKIVGLVSSSITVPVGFETAIEVALGGAVQDIITQNEKDSKDLIQYLKKNDLGRATFLPIATMKPKFLSSAEEMFTKRKNCHGVASKIIKFDSSLKNVFDSLLGRTVVVDTIDDAVDLAKTSNFAFKIVTLDGDVINPVGSMSGGSAKAITANLLSREVEIEELAKQLVKLKEQSKDVTDKKIIYQKQFGVIQKELEDANAKAVSAQIESASKSQSLAQFNIYLEEHNKESQALNKERLQLSANIEAIASAINNIDDSDGKISNNKEHANKSINARQLIFNTLRQKRDKYHEEMTAIKVKIASLEGDISSISGELARLTEYSKTLENSIVEQVNSLSKLTNAISGAQGAISSDSNDLYEKSIKDLETVKNKMAGLDEYKQKLQLEIKLLDEDRSNLTEDMNRALDKRYKEEMLLAKVDTDLETLQERIFEEYELTYSSCEPFRVEGYNLHDGLVQTSVLKKDIGRLGYVNVNAIEEAKLVGERFYDMDGQAQDLIKAKEDLIKIIKELAVEMITRFEKEFTQIQANFSKVFKELFGGGNAKLELVPSEDGDPLNAGVEIIAEPPGKKLQSITLLSGGEKALTAIAILFAILRLRPMPFCLLDEIEAALDEANVERFASYLKRFSQDTQFIVITHRKPTMELADRLYGVTMEEKGVSKVVTVNLGEAVKTAK